MVKARVADVTVSLYWDQRRKVWTATVSGTGHSEWKTIRTTNPIDQPAAWLLLGAVEREMLSWLPMD